MGNIKMEIFLLLISLTLILIVDWANRQNLRTLVTDQFQEETVQAQKKLKHMIVILDGALNKE